MNGKGSLSLLQGACDESRATDKNRITFMISGHILCITAR